MIGNGLDSWVNREVDKMSFISDWMIEGIEFIIIQVLSIVMKLDHYY